MKEYKLSGWPELPASYQRTAYQRMLHQMSQGFVPFSQLVRNSGLNRELVRQFLAELDQRGVLQERLSDTQAPTLLRSAFAWPWLRRALGTPDVRRS